MGSQQNAELAGVLCCTHSPTCHCVPVCVILEISGGGDRGNGECDSGASMVECAGKGEVSGSVLCTQNDPLMVK